MLYAFTPRFAVRSSITYDSNYQGVPGAAPIWYASYAPAIALVANASSRTSLYVEGTGATKVAPGLGPEYKLGAGARHKIGASTAIDVGFDDGLTVVDGARSHAFKVGLTQALR